MATEPSTSLDCKPYSYREARQVAQALDLSEPTAITLVRRGYRTPEAASEFLAGREQHDPFEFDSMARITARLLAAARAGRRITVHGDYDVDGVCSTAILVRVLTELGASCDWLIPDRAADGYGLTLGTVGALANRGTKMILTADCGIACATEVEAAKEAGIETIITDHHKPDGVLPDCPILHPVVSGYPFAELCATAVAHKLALALRKEAGADAASPDPDLELVALATVADVVPLVGENRRLVREGIAAARLGARPGMRALMEVSKTDPSTLDASDLGFRLAPRINAAGRLYRADAGVELMLTDDPERAGEIAAELDRANAERRTTEREVLQQAEAELASLDPELRDAPAIVLAGEDWHPGVIGIVASRLVDRYFKPVVAIGLQNRIGRGSGRSIPGFDLVDALSACSGHLIKFGGHAAAAGLEIAPEEVEPFRRAFAAHAAERIAPDQLVRHQRIDAVAGVGADGVGLDLAEEIERLGPFGAGNPEPRLLIPAARLREVTPMGESERHARFQLESGTGRAAGVAFNAGSTLGSLENGRADLVVRLEVNRWNGSVSPRVVLDAPRPLPDPPEEIEQLTCPAPAGPEEWWRRIDEEIEAPLDGWQASPAINEAFDRGRAGSDREVVDRRGGALIAALGELASGGGSVLALCGDAARRRALVERAIDPRRFAAAGAPEPGVACPRCADDEVRALLERTAAPGGLALADWPVLQRTPGAPAAFEHIVMIEPPPFAHYERLSSVGDGYLHLAWGEAEVELAERLLDREWRLRPQIVDLYRAAAAAGELTGADLAVALRGPGRYPRSPEIAARCVRVLVEVGLCAWDGTADTHGGATRETSHKKMDPARAPCLRVVSSEATNLERSQAYVAYRTRHEEGAQFLRRPPQPQTLPKAA